MHSGARKRVLLTGGNGALGCNVLTLLQTAAAEFKRKLTILRPFAFTGAFDRANRLFPLILQAAVDGTNTPLETAERDYGIA